MITRSALYGPLPRFCVNNWPGDPHHIYAWWARSRIISLVGVFSGSTIFLVKEVPSLPVRSRYGVPKMPLRRRLINWSNVWRLHGRWLRMLSIVGQLTTFHFPTRYLTRGKTTLSRASGLSHTFSPMIF